ncbi:hypothetical protein IGI37_002271 [Enterococcus sp. AZ194]|uniref:HNH endonuclease n=1 Tax=Enterococcus sp. AZ194 TaxID=2774629 RepID=UPI003F1FBA0F
MRVCKCCGKDISKKSLKAIYCSTKCRNTYNDGKHHLSWIQFQKKRSKINERRKIETKNRKEKQKLERELKIKCKVCGNSFVTNKSQQLTCSSECRKKWKNRKSDKRISKHNTIDRDITLVKLYERDKGVCYICGEQCDFEDFNKNEVFFVCGKTYPTVDHIVPIAKGGLHAWCNVRLAHHFCNSIKSDKLSEKYHNIQQYCSDSINKPSLTSSRSKRVRQLTKEGEILAEYKSTINAEHETNIKQRGIQKCARKECKSYGGYSWEYF